MKRCSVGGRAHMAGVWAFALWSSHLAKALADEPSSKDVADMDIEELAQVRVSPFEVSTAHDKGYRGSNAVSGSRFDAPIGNLPFAIQAFTEPFIVDQKPLNVFDVARYSPGVTYRSNDFNEGNANLAIRGFTVANAPGDVQILRDGFHGPSIFDFTNISRVEVVKGPASFLYGQVAPGGVVNVITKTPQPKFGAVGEMTYGAYGQYRFEADVTGPFDKGVFYRFATSDANDGHYWKPYDAQSRTIAPSLLWRINDRVSVTLKYENYHKLETPQLMQKPGYNTQAGVTPTPSDPNLSGVDVPGLPNNWNSMAYSDFRRSTVGAFNAWLDYKADDHWNLRAGYSHLDYSIDAIFTGNLGMGNNQTFLQGRRVRRQTYANHENAFEVQSLGYYAADWASLRLLLGARYVHRSFDNRAGQAPNDPALGTDPTATPLPFWDLRDPSTWNRNATVPIGSLNASALDTTTTFADASFYGGTTFGFFKERLLVLAGWRLTTTNGHLADNMKNQADSIAHVTMVTPQYGVLYKLISGLSAYASYSESFVPPTSLLNNPDGTKKIAEPVRGYGYDVGLKADLFDRISGTVTYFEIANKEVRNDLSVLDPKTGAQMIYNVQSGEQRSRGVEVDATLLPTNDWQIYLSYSYIDAKITEFSGNDAAILAQDPSALDAAGRANYKNVARFHGAPLQMSAPHLANLWTRYDIARGALAGAYAAGGVNFVYDQTILPDTPESAHQTYALLNVLFGYSWKCGGHRMMIEYMGKNLADERYRPSQSTRSRPREFLVTFRVKF